MLCLQLWQYSPDYNLTEWESHCTYRSKTTIIPKPAETYLRRRIHRKEWSTRLRSEAMRARNRIPLNVQQISELREIAGKFSTFTLQKIWQQIMLTKKGIKKYDQRLRLATEICFVLHIRDMDCLVFIIFQQTGCQCNWIRLPSCGD